MIPIYEQGSGNGIGHGLDSFLNRFDFICAEHRKEGRAKAFAFIFYDFTDKAIRHILKNQGVFAKLDRLSGKELSVFYLHTGTRHAIETFNINFLAALGVEDRASLPCVVFFRYENRNVSMKIRHHFQFISVERLCIIERQHLLLRNAPERHDLHSIFLWADFRPWLPCTRRSFRIGSFQLSAC